MRKFYLALVLLMAFSMVLVVSCNEEDDTDDDDIVVVKTKKELLVDRWWYNNPDVGRGDHFFGSDGTIKLNSAAVATYVWTVNDSMSVTAQGGATVTWWIKSVTETTMEYWPTNEPASNIYKFTSTEP